MTWLNRFARRWNLAPRPAAASRPRHFRPTVEQLQRRDVPALFAPSSLSGYVYVDANDSGVFDSGETPLSGVTVTLTGTLEDNTTVSLTTTTNASGLYSFTNLDVGSYTITETPPSGYIDGKDAVGTQGYGTAGHDQISGIFLGQSVNGTDNNFAELTPTPPPVSPPPPVPPPPCTTPTGSLSGVVYFDCNKDGVFDNGDSGIAGVTITLTGPGGTRTATTDSSGRYEFTDLIAGTYTITEAPPAGYTQGATAPGTPTDGTANGDVISGVVVGSTALVGYNFGETRSCDTGGHPACGGGTDTHGHCGAGSDWTCNTVWSVHTGACGSGSTGGSGAWGSLWTCASSGSVHTGVCGGVDTNNCGTHSLWTCGTSRSVGTGICGSGGPESGPACGPSHPSSGVHTGCAGGAQAGGGSTGAGGGWGSLAC
ncbi:SdrD B-like domain-containing protein [Frigoriglobus tundricola]|uniref:SD-repeat containing protein B domain-containing protein n=1 Tax=Frigoriglobus tundricola TaxID=2774151 RepID=A0A6M5YWC9_9BACT|nr:SdrD B-like domain-containing protein [Frigoriglobus tundricola]QJW98249.1 hypothetical protein FTUN_5835 [Frigoriglobus tundricola]